MMERYENISTVRCGKEESKMVAKTEKADNQRSKELIGTFLALLWLPFGNEIGKDSLLKVKVS